MLDFPNVKRETSEHVLSLLAQGSPNKEIATFLNIDPKDVKQHLRALFLDLVVAMKTCPAAGPDLHRDKPEKGSDTAPEPKTAGLGLPCARCRAYYPVDMNACPFCKSSERTSPPPEPVFAPRKGPPPEPYVGAPTVPGSKSEGRDALLMETGLPKPPVRMSAKVVRAEGGQSLPSCKSLEHVSPKGAPPMEIGLRKPPAYLQAFRTAAGQRPGVVADCLRNSVRRVGSQLLDAVRRSMDRIRGAFAVVR